MKSKVLQRFLVILAITVAALYIVFGPRTTEAARTYLTGGFQRTLEDNINLGLDLKGGSQLVMQVQVNDYLQTVTQNTMTSITQAARRAGYATTDARTEIGNNSFRIILDAADAAKADEADDKLRDNIDLQNFTSDVNGNVVTWTMTREAVRRLSEEAVALVEQRIENRINAVGVAEPTLQRHGAPTSHQLLLQMPGLQDPERIKELLKAQARLELMNVVTTPQQIYSTREEALQSLGGTLPPNRNIFPYVERDIDDVETNVAPPPRFMIVEIPAIVAGNDLKGATAVQGRSGGDNYEIDFELKPEPAQKFGAWTAAHIGQPLAIVLDGEIKSAPTIQGAISDRGQITGSFTRQAAEDLASNLRSGALPARIVYQEERTVGPSLGADSIRAGVRASVAGLVLIILFMVFYYRGSGINAVVALLLNFILTMAALVIFDATLTLPGIAGLILTLGMAVDSNVLIFERIREELQSGKTVPSSIDQGFARAFVAIIDTHVTTIISSLFLFVFGTSTIRGFAVTLILGLIINLFTAVYVSRTIFMWVVNRRRAQGQRVETLSI
ncbi:MAG: protein translocase subunit SecD [Pyrinomonadaceae bacterium MAG19_C2-C3]|nr:protein translocase subunit SecD [Pyrinomonadaceae bacterium MAG19_C2-C3]